PKRPAEIEGVDYHFVGEKEFHRMIEHNDFLEYATVFHHFYGTSRTWVQHTLARGSDVILEIDWQGCLQIQRIFPHSISVFILPPSLADLSDRLKKRNQDNDDIIQQRLADTRETVSHVHDFNYVIVNDDFDRALNELKTIIQAGRLQQEKQTVKLSNLLNELLSSPTSSPTHDRDAEKE
ncbi:MAG TPA: guanylate kinase, partial [Gammaproteobacteria bacterium]|nr:guanylate kinase [Gammaproteobacteria bacterium]